MTEAGSQAARSLKRFFAPHRRWHRTRVRRRTRGHRTRVHRRTRGRNDVEHIEEVWHKERVRKPWEKELTVLYRRTGDLLVWPPDSLREPRGGASTERCGRKPRFPIPACDWNLEAALSPTPRSVGAVRTHVRRRCMSVAGAWSRSGRDRPMH